jgi:adenylate cyclase
MGASHYIMEEHEQAVTLYRRALEERPNARWIYRDLAGSLVGAGHLEEAQRAYAELIRSYPDLTITKFKRAMVFSDAVLERMAENLKKLGLPE